MIDAELIGPDIASILLGFDLSGFCHAKRPVWGDFAVFTETSLFFICRQY